MKWANHKLVSVMRDNAIPFLTEQELRSPLLKIIMTLRKVHKVGFLLNNISPSNILFAKKSQSYKVKLCGLSKCTPIDLAHQVQSPPITLFSAPEIIMEGSFSVASDIWSLGATIYTLANGRLPFEDTTGILTKELDWNNRYGVQFNPDFV